jgi:uncharacterized protein DUF5681
MPKEVTQFKPGQSGNPNGRPKGSPNKFKFDVTQILKDAGCNPFQILADIAMGNESAHARTNAATELCSYVAPKLKHIEHAADSESPFTITLNLGGNNNTR